MIVPSGRLVGSWVYSAPKAFLHEADDFLGAVGDEITRPVSGLLLQAWRSSLRLERSGLTPKPRLGLRAPAKLQKFRHRPPQNRYLARCL